MVRPKKYFGQHFLADKTAAVRLAEILHKAYEGPVLEVGPGTGVLTRELLNYFTNLHVVEIDQESVDHLKTHFTELLGSIHNTDFLKANIGEWFESSFALCGNYPYNISSQIIFKMLDERARIPFMAGMFQLELAQRLVSDPGNKTYGGISVMLQSYYRCKLEFKIKPGAFFPPPKVDSAVISCTRKEVQPPCGFESLNQITRAAFGQRRKTLGNALKQIPLPIRNELPSHLLNLRAEQLDIEMFHEMAAILDQLKAN